MLGVRHLFKAKPLSPQFLSVFASPSYRNLSAQKQDASVVEIQEQDENEILAREEEIEQMRNKSGLYPADYNRQHDRPPYDEPKTPIHETLRHKRKLYGKYGESSKVNPSILWPSKVELAAIKEWIGVAQPFTVQELIKRCEEKKQMEKEERKKQEAEILERVRKIPLEIIEFKKRVEKKRLKAEEILEKKNRLINETKKHFDYPIDVRDEKFQLKLAEIQEAHRKQAKAERKLKKMSKKTSETKPVQKEDSEKTSENVE